jgi:hypothetical protein
MFEEPVAAPGAELSPGPGTGGDAVGWFPPPCATSAAPARSVALTSSRTSGCTGATGDVSRETSRPRGSRSTPGQPSGSDGNPRSTGNPIPGATTRSASLSDSTVTDTSLSDRGKATAPSNPTRTGHAKRISVQFPTLWISLPTYARGLWINLRITPRQPGEGPSRHPSECPRVGRFT